MSRFSIKYIVNAFFKSRRDFSVFVSEASKQEKERTLQKAADIAIKQQREILDAFPAATV